MANLLEPTSWKSGTVMQNAAKGASYNNVVTGSYTGRIATIEPVPTGGSVVTLDFDEGYRVWVCAFDADVRYLGLHSGAWQTSPCTCDFDGAEYLAVAVRKATNGAISPDEAGTVSMVVSPAGGGWLND